MISGMYIGDLLTSCYFSFSFEKMISGMYMGNLIISCYFPFSFEKMISGMYMGELVRLVLCELCDQGLIFDGQGSEELFSPQRFYTKYISEIER